MAIAGEEADTALKGQAAIYRYMLGFADSMALKTALELHIADIINSHGQPMKLSDIAASIKGAGPSVHSSGYLGRIMRFLVSRDIFSVHESSDGGGDLLYGLTPSSNWLVRQSEFNIVPLIIMFNHPLQLAPWHCLSQCVKEGGTAFKKAHGMEMYEMASKNPEFNEMFNDSMACIAKMMMKEITSIYKDGFSQIGTLVDVGGGTGGVIAEIVKAHPYIRGINFDLPHVVATAPPHEGIEHVGGSMFDFVPKADAIFIKCVLHNWADEDCIKILNKCRESISDEMNGKLIIIDAVLEPEGKSLFGDIASICDMAMLALTSGGKERTEVEWKKVLEQGGFPRYNIIKIAAPQSIIEAFPH